MESEIIEFAWDDNSSSLLSDEYGAPTLAEEWRCREQMTVAFKIRNTG